MQDDELRLDAMLAAWGASQELSHWEADAMLGEILEPVLLFLPPVWWQDLMHASFRGAFPLGA